MSLSRGSVSEMFLRLCSRAPEMTMESVGIGPSSLPSSIARPTSGCHAPSNEVTGQVYQTGVRHGKPRSEVAAANAVRVVSTLVSVPDQRFLLPPLPRADPVAGGEQRHGRCDQTA